MDCAVSTGRKPRPSCDVLFLFFAFFYKHLRLICVERNLYFCTLMNILLFLGFENTICLKNYFRDNMVRRYEKKKLNNNNNNK